MNKLFLLFIIVLIGQNSLAAATSCIDTRPSKECIEKVSPDTGSNKVRAAEACSGGVSVECIDYIYADAGHSRLRAAEACKGGVTKECIDYVYSDSGFNKVRAAKACSGL
ncbi:MAG: hypothetical protein ACXVCY_00175 [Pseudobdellovibrionaceae bacterium]